MKVYLELVVKSDELLHAVLPHVALPVLHLLPLQGLAFAEESHAGTETQSGVQTGIDLLNVLSCSRLSRSAVLS